MKIDVSAFSRSLSTPEPEQEEVAPAGFGQGASGPVPAPAGGNAAPQPPVHVDEEDGHGEVQQQVLRAPLFSRPGDQAAAPAAQPEQEQQPASQEKKAKWWTPKKKAAPQSEAPGRASAKKPNTSRPMVIVAAALLAGAILGPWLSQKAAPPAPQAAGPNEAAKQIAETLRGGGLGSTAEGTSNPTPPAAPAAQETVEEAPERAPIAAQGDARYLAMLDRMKEDKPAADGGPKVVPKLDASAAPAASGGTARTSAGQRAVNVDPYPEKPIPLDIEQGAQTQFAAQRPEPRLAVVQGEARPGNFVVLRIDRNADGVWSALMMPAGGRIKSEAAWVFVGDSTSDGFEVQSIAAGSVSLRTPTGRYIQLTP